MGNWNITIQGTGAHHNDSNPLAQDTIRDAEKLAAEFVEKLKAVGQKVESATFTYGGREELGGEDAAEIRRLQYIIADKRSPAG